MGSRGSAPVIPGGRMTSTPTSLSPAPYPSLPPERRKLAHFAASPLPNKAFGFAGGPIFGGDSPFHKGALARAATWGLPYGAYHSWFL